MPFHPNILQANYFPKNVCLYPQLPKTAFVTLQITSSGILPQLGCYCRAEILLWNPSSLRRWGVILTQEKVQQWAASHCFCLTHTQQGAVPGSAVTQLTPEASNWLHLSRQSFPSSSASEVDNRCLWGPGMQRKWMKFRRARPPVNWRSFAPSKEGRCYSTLANCHQIWKSLSF